MKIFVLFILTVTISSCDGGAELIGQIGNELLEEKNYQVGLSEGCSDSAFKIWYCISKDEYDRLIAIPQSCETILITTINANKYSGIINSDSLLYGEQRCNL